MLGTCDGPGLSVLAGPGPHHHHHHGGHGGGGGWGWGGPAYYGPPYYVQADDIDAWLAQPDLEAERLKCLAEKHTWDAKKARCIG